MLVTAGVLQSGPFCLRPLASHAGGRQVGAQNFRDDEMWPIDRVARGQTVESVGLALDAIFRSPAVGFIY
jgi:hypothetical protein